MATVDRNEPVYLISVAAKICELHPQTLRLYERLGLIRPSRVSKKNRMYSEADIARLKQIQRLTQDMGINLAGVEVILNLLDQMQKMREEAEREVNRMRQEMEARIKELMDQRG